jgi:hypothetical protein
LAAALPPTAEQFRELGADRRFFLPQLLDSCNGAKTGQAPQLILLQVRHSFPP